MPHSESPPPGSSPDFPWFEQRRIIVVEGEVLVSGYEAPPEADVLLPPRSSC